MKRIYYNYRKIFSYNYDILVIVGARGIGKTYGAQKHVIKDFIYKNKKFVWLRDNGEACEELSKNNGDKFFSAIMKEFPTHKGIIKDNNIYIDDKHAGYIFPLSTYYNYKGNAYNEIKNIVFDEFIKEKAQRNTSGRIIQFLNTIETIGRMRNDFKVIMLANALDRGDEIFSLFNIKIFDYGYYFNKEKRIVLHYAENNPAYEILHENSISGRLIKGTDYEKPIVQNVFNDDSAQFFSKKPPKCKLFCILHNSDGIGVRLYYCNNIVYASKDINTECYNDIRFVKRIQEVTTKRTLISKDFLNTIKVLYNNNKVLFENGYIRNIFIDFLT
jgi:5S rRNA maturation endonuclease (ribonuclease M5)